MLVMPITVRRIQTERVRRLYLQSPRNRYKQTADNKLRVEVARRERLIDIALVDAVGPKNESNNGSENVQERGHVLAEAKNLRFWVGHLRGLHAN